MRYSNLGEKKYTVTLFSISRVSNSLREDAALKETGARDPVEKNTTGQPRTS